MSQTRVFLSSTCYDLRAVREHIREKVRELGHELLASEYPSFPVAADLSTVENCKRVVREHADLFVLIVGGRRGNLDPSGTRSIVNAEYMEAKASGLDTFVFVDRQVWDLLPVYQKNPDTDFSPVVDHPEVFKFVAQLKEDSRWIYPFSKTDDIITTLKTRFSIHLRMLIERGRAGSLVVPRAFASDPPKIISLIQERPPYWEYLLTSEYLEQTVVQARKQLRDLDAGLIFRPVLLVPGEEVGTHVQRVLADITNLSVALSPALDEITAVLNPRNSPADPLEIRNACQRLALLVSNCVEWETNLRFLKPLAKAAALFGSLQGSTAEIIDKLSLVAPQMRDGLRLAETGPGPHRILIELRLETPKSVARFHEELQKLIG